MVKYPKFSERIFEFAFNAEFAARNHAILAACPSLPTPQEEKNEGYDIEFELKRRGGGKEYLFLQHKVARRVTSVGPSNALRDSNPCYSLKRILPERLGQPSLAA